MPSAPDCRRPILSEDPRRVDFLLTQFIGHDLSPLRHRLVGALRRHGPAQRLRVARQRTLQDRRRPAGARLRGRRDRRRQRHRRQARAAPRPAEHRGHVRPAVGLRLLRHRRRLEAGSAGPRVRGHRRASGSRCRAPTLTGLSRSRRAAHRPGHRRQDRRPRCSPSSATASNKLHRFRARCAWKSSHRRRYKGIAP